MDDTSLSNDRPSADSDQLAGAGRQLADPPGVYYLTLGEWTIWEATPPSGPITATRAEQVSRSQDTRASSVANLGSRRRAQSAVVLDGRRPPEARPHRRVWDWAQGRELRSAQPGEPAD
jgi:hypothetical protein